MSLTAQSPQPSLAWQFESSNVDSVAALAPSSQVSPGPAQLQGSAALVTNAPTSNTAVSFDGTAGGYMTLGTSTPTNFNTNSSNLFVEAWVYAISTVNPTRIYGRGASISSTVSYDFTFRINAGSLGVANGTTTVSAPGTVTVGVWYHCALSITTTGLTTVFLNGQAGTPTTITMPYRSTYDTYIGAMTNQYTNGYIRDLRVIKGGVVPTASFTPEVAPFTYALPSYVTGSGTTVFTLLGQFITYNPSGKYGSAVSIINYPTGTPNTGNVYITYNNPLTISATVGTSISAWVNISQLPAVSEKSIVFAINGSSGGQIWIEFYTTGAQAVIYNLTNYFVVFNSSPPSLSIWNHYTVVCNSSTLSFYVNGVLVGTTNITNPPSFSGGYIYIGGLGNYSPFSGLIDDLRIFNTALSDTQVNAIYNQQGVSARWGAARATYLLSLIPSSPVFMQTFGTSTVPTKDVYGATLSSSGSPTMYLDPIRGYVFPGTGTTYMTSNFNLPVSYSKTVWVYLTGAPGTGNIISSTTNAVNGVHYFYFSSTYSMRAGHSTGTTVTTYITDPGTITLNQWTHYVLTYDQPTTTMKLFRDGVQVASTTNAALSWSGGNSVGLCHYNASSTLNNGYIDNPIIYNRALNQSEISTLYTAQLNNPTLGDPTSGLIYNPINLSGIPLFTQLSTSATSSAVGAFSLRAVNGTSARAVQVGARASLPSFTTSATSLGSNSYSQTLTGYSFGGSGTYTTTGSSIYNTSTTQPWKAFDSDTTTWWETTGGLYNTLANGGAYTGTQTITIGGVPTSCEWIIIQIPSSVVLSSYSMYARSGFTQRMPKNFKIAGSNDGTTWTTVDTQTNQTTWTAQTPITFTTTSSTPYKYFALCVTAITSAGTTNNLNVGQWTLNGSWQTDFYADRLGNLLTSPVTGQTLANWLGGATGYVTTWYDQSGSGNNFIQTATAKQPQIVINSGKWAVFFNRDATPTFYSNLSCVNNITGVQSIIYNFNVSSTFNTYQTLLGQNLNDNGGFRFNNRLIGTSGNNRDFLAGTGSYWYLNNNYGSQPTQTNSLYTDNIWNYVIGVCPSTSSAPWTAFQFNSISSPATNLIVRAAYGYLSEMLIFTSQIGATDAGVLYTTRYQ